MVGCMEGKSVHRILYIDWSDVFMNNTIKIILAYQCSQERETNNTTTDRWACSRDSLQPSGHLLINSASEQPIS